MTFAISIGRWGGFYWHRDYTIRPCLGWVALTFYPFDIDSLHDKQFERFANLMGCYHGAVSDVARYHEALDLLYDATLNELTARDLPHQWSPGSAMAKASAALAPERTDMRAALLLAKAREEQLESQ